MQKTMLIETEVNVTHIRMELAVRYGEDDMPRDFPFRHGNTWDVTVEIDTGLIVDWPEGVEHELYMKACDCGTYTLYTQTEHGGLRELSCIVEDYVPHGIIPGDYGDYVNLKILGNGAIENWPEVDDINLSAFPHFANEDMP